MVAYVIVTMTVHDPETYRKYTAQTPAIVKRFGGRFLTRGNPVNTMEGDKFTERMVILEFPSTADFEACFKSPEYVEAVKYRHAAATSRVIVQEGVSNTENPEPDV